uniref:Uncharacterized protein n=1 Tax=Globodera rostochiensis TaxID=31243 RepID=A0A914HLP5_GLORO
MAILLHPALMSASNRLAAMNSFGTFLNRWQRTSLFRVDGTVLTQFRMIRRGGGDRQHSVEDYEAVFSREAKEEAEQQTRRAKEESEQQTRRAKEEATRRAKEEATRRANEEATRRANEEATRRAKEEAEQLLLEIRAELRSFSWQSMFTYNIKEADANVEEQLKTRIRDFNKHLYLNKRLSAYELEPVANHLVHYNYAMRVFYAGIGLVIVSMLIIYRLLSRGGDGIMPEHRAIIDQQLAIDFDEFVQDYLLVGGEVKIVYVYPDKSIAIAVLHPGAALIQRQPFNDSAVLIRLDPQTVGGTNFLRTFEDVQQQIGTYLCNHVPAAIPMPSLMPKFLLLLGWAILWALYFKHLRAMRRRPIFIVKRRDGTRPLIQSDRLRLS